MSEMYFAIRDGVGINSTVVFDGIATLIKDLPAGKYALQHGDQVVCPELCPNQLPGFLLDYCTRLEAEDFKFKGESVYEIISNLELMLSPN